MAKDRAIGAVLVIAAIVGVLVYGSLMFLFGGHVSMIVLEITAFVAVLAILVILGWIGYVMATTPPPVPLEPEPAPSGDLTSGQQSSATEKKS